MAGKKPLTPKQAQFVEEYAIDLCATKAAIRAGYSAKTAEQIGCQLLRKPQVKLAVEAAMQARSQRTEITADRVLQEYALLAFADMADYLRFADDGNVYLDWSNLPEGATRVVGEVVQDVYTEGRGEDGREVKRTRFKLHPKLPALEALAKHLLLFPNPKQAHEHTGPDGGPIDTKTEIDFSKLTTDDLRNLRDIAGRSASGAGATDSD